MRMRSTLHAKYICVPCRMVWPHPLGKGSCPYCHGRIRVASYKWGAPRKNNDKAWKRIENEDWLWELPKLKVSDGHVKWNGRGWTIWKNKRYQPVIPLI